MASSPFVSPGWATRPPQGDDTSSDRTRAASRPPSAAPTGGLPSGPPGLAGLAALVVLGVAACAQQPAQSTNPPSAVARPTSAPRAAGASTAGGSVVARSEAGGVVSVRTDRVVRLSRNGGATYTALASLPVAATDVRDVAASASQAYLAAVVSGRPRVWATSDGGAAWTAVTLTQPAGATGDAAGVRLVMAGRALAGLLVRAQSSSNFVTGQWYEASTETLSKPWTGHSAADIGAVTATLTDAGSGVLWAVTGPVSSGLATSTDGGTSWHAVSLHGCTTGDAALTVLGASAGGAVVVAATAATDSGATWKTCEGSGNGTWSSSSWTSVPGLVGPGVSLPSTLAGDSAVMVTPDGARIAVVQVTRVGSTGPSPTLLSPHGLPSGVSDVSGSSATSLTAVVSSDRCPSGTTASCAPSAASYSSTDGGRTWQPITPG